MSNQDLYKQAIAEAKSIRETAIANAKLALEESLTPHLKELLAQKLQEMEEEEMEEELELTEEGEAIEEAKEEDEKEEAEEEAEEAEDDSEESEDEAEEGQEIEDMTVEDLKELIRDILSQEMEMEDEMDAMSDMEAGEEEAMDMVSADDEETINIDEILAELAEEEDSNVKEEEENLNEAEDVVTFAQYLADMGVENAMNVAKYLMTAASVAGVGGIAALANLVSKKQEKGMEKELKEAVKTIKGLQNQLNEVNLLNAKLLYVNKLFKANNLTESQKVNTIAAFDKATTVKEAKLVYESISTNIVTKKEAPKSSIREHRSFASKAAGVAPKRKEVISEANDVVKRMQKLAGIIK